MLICWPSVTKPKITFSGQTELGGHPNVTFSGQMRILEVRLAFL